MVRKSARSQPVCFFCCKIVKNDSSKSDDPSSDDQIQNLEQFFNFLERLLGNGTTFLKIEAQVKSFGQKGDGEPTCMDCSYQLNLIRGLYQKVKSMEIDIMSKIKTLLRVMKLASRVTSRMTKAKENFELGQGKNKFEKFMKTRDELIKQCTSGSSMLSPKEKTVSKAEQYSQTDDSISKIHNKENVDPTIFQPWLLSLVAISSLAVPSSVDVHRINNTTDLKTFEIPLDDKITSPLCHYSESSGTADAETSRPSKPEHRQTSSISSIKTEPVMLDQGSPTGDINGVTKETAHENATPTISQVKSMASVPRNRNKSAVTNPGEESDEDMIIDVEAEDKPAQDIKPNINSIVSKQSTLSKSDRQLKIKIGEAVFDVQVDVLNNQKTPKKIFVCLKCDKTFANHTLLSQHKLKVHKSEESKPTNTCQVCGVECLDSASLRMHSISHNASHKCEVCEKEFASLWNLIMHMRNHANKKLFLCTLCGRVFGDSSNLTAHSKTHADASKHKCKQCKMSFIFKTQLMKHKCA